MKKIILSSTIFFHTLLLFCQQQWETLPINPESDLGLVHDIEVIDGKIYQIYSIDNSGNTTLQSMVYNPKIKDWDYNLIIQTPSVLFDKIVTEKINNIIYIAAQYQNELHFYQLNTSTNTMSQLTSPYAEAGLNTNWQFHAGKNPNELYILYTSGTGPSDVHALEYVSGTNSWTHLSESSTQDLSLAELQIQSTSDRVFFGVMSNKLRMTYFFKGNLTFMAPFDGANGEVLVEGLNWDNQGFVLTGNLNDYKALYATENANNKSYEVEIIEGSAIDIALANPSTSFNLDVSSIAKESSSSHGFIMSNFSSDGLGNPNDKLNVIRRDFTQSATNWELVSPIHLETNATALEQKSVKLSLDNGGLHLGAAYTILGADYPTIKVLNNVPYVSILSDLPSQSICADEMNIIFPSLEIVDEDFDKVKITNIVSVQGQTINLQAIPIGFVDGVSKFKILGKPTNQTDNLIIFYTDGYNTYSYNLSNFTATATSPNVQFTSNPVLFCANDVQLDLSQFVNYYDQGAFRINGRSVNGSQINAKELGLEEPTGIVRFIQNINGCIVSSQANYEVIQAPSISMAVTPSACGTNNGSATATVTPGLSSNLVQYWSTGQSGLTLSNLAPGAYYYFVIDEYNCKANALASILSSDITITGTISHPTCYGANDGNVEITVSGTSNFQVVWSNGEFGLNLTNVKADVYECTLYDASGCEIKKGYNIIQPPKVDFNFTTVKPDCGLENGIINTNLTGGAGPYTYLWNTSSTSSNLFGIGNGHYTLTVTDNNNCIYKDSLFLNNTNSVIVQDSIFSANCGMADGGVNLKVFETAESGNINYIQWDNGSIEEDIYNLEAGNYFLTINYGNDCFFQKNYIVNTLPPLKNEICVVTVDEQSTTNLVVWEKDESIPVSYYTIYRENSNAGSYTLVDTVHFNNISVFNDVIASPLHRSWRYRIGAVNECGVESALSIPHKTLHLNTIEQSTPGTFDIYWDRYEGIQNGTYIINRFTDQAGWIEIGTTPFGSQTVFTDTPPVGSSGLDYYVGFELATPCTATFRAQDFDVSRSNKNKGIFNPGEGTGFPSNAGIMEAINESQITIYPNPFDEFLNVNITGNKNVTVRLFDAQGKIVLNQNCYSGLNQLQTNNLHTGLFFVQIHSGNEIRTFKLSKTN
jgi:fibronectin type 3 domain-containing protein